MKKKHTFIKIKHLLPTSRWFLLVLTVIIPMLLLSVVLVSANQYNPVNHTSLNNPQPIPAKQTDASVSISVVDVNNNPIGAMVKILNLEGHSEWEAWSTPNNPAVFTLPVNGHFFAEAWPSMMNIPMLANSNRLHFEVTPNGNNFTLHLREPDVVGVALAPNGGPLPPVYNDAGNLIGAALVEVFTPYWETHFEFTTNLSGEFSIALPSSGNFELLARPHYEFPSDFTKSEIYPFAFSGDPTAPPIDVGAVKLTYPRVMGWVQWPDGTKATTWVNIWGDNGYWDDSDTYWVTANDAQPFKLGGMPPGHYYVQADPPETNTLSFGGSNIYEFDVLSTGELYDPTFTQEITLTLAPANVMGQLLFPNQSPVQHGVWIEIHNADYTITIDTEPDENGSYVFSGLDSGDYVIEFFLDENLALDWKAPPPLPITLVPPDNIFNPDPQYLQPIQHTKQVMGMVTDQSGVGIDNAIVYAHHEDSGFEREFPTNPDGSYNFFLIGGGWNLGVRPAVPNANWYFNPEDEQWVEFPYDPNIVVTKTINFGVTRINPNDFFNVTGLVLKPDGTPPPADLVWVDLCSDEGHCFGAPTDANGNFDLWALPGIYEPHMWVDPTLGLAPALLPAEFILTADKYIELTLRDRSNATLTGLVSGRVIISDTGNGLVDVDVEAWTEQGDWANTQTDSNGNYNFRLFPGQWHGGPFLSPAQLDEYFVLPPQYKGGRLKAGDVISNVNFYLARRNATIVGQIVEMGSTTVLTEVEAIVSAELCNANGHCNIVDEHWVQGGNFELNVLGGYTYQLSIWLPRGGYLAGDIADITVATGDTATTEIGLTKAGTRIHGNLVNGETGDPVIINASVSGYDSNDNFFVEDFVWEGRDPFEYQLDVPTPPGPNSVVWTLDLWVDPATGYIPDPAHPTYEVSIEANRTEIYQSLSVIPLDTFIEGTVEIGNPGGANPVASYVWVFAKGVANTQTEGLYFETQTNAAGEFIIPVLPGSYVVSAYLPPELHNSHFPPMPKTWHTVNNNPVSLIYRTRPNVGDVNINGSLTVVDGSGNPINLPVDTEILVFGWSDDGAFSEVTGTIASGYRLPAIANNTWYVWAVYEDLENDIFYHSLEEEVQVGIGPTTQNLILHEANFELPNAVCESFEADTFKRISLPTRPELPEPLMEIQANTMPVSGTVEICATPKIAVAGGPNLVGFSYELEARDSSGNLITEDFNKDIRFIFYYHPDIIGELDPNDLEPAFYSTARQEWVEFEDVFIDPNDLFVTGKINHFSQMGLLGKTSTSSGNSVYLPLILK